MYKRQVIVTGFSQDSYSLSFDGQDDYVEAGSNVNLSSTPFSIEVWYKSQPITTAAATNIIDNYGSGQSSANSWNLHIAGSGEGANAGKVKFWNAFGGNLISDSRIDDGEWHHIAIERYDDGIIKMFIDGNDNNTGTLDLAADIYSGYNLLIGSRHYNRFHSCTISEAVSYTHLTLPTIYSV